MHDPYVASTDVVAGRHPSGKAMMTPVERDALIRCAQHGQNVVLAQLPRMGAALIGVAELLAPEDFDALFTNPDRAQDRPPWLTSDLARKLMALARIPFVAQRSVPLNETLLVKAAACDVDPGNDALVAEALSALADAAFEAWTI